MNTIAFIGSASGWGAQIRETSKGPEFLQNSGVLSALKSNWVWKKTIHPSGRPLEHNIPPGPLTLPYIKDLCHQVSLSVEQALLDLQFPVIIGGDHVVATGTWAGVAHYLKARQKFGLIWIDAHMDAHTIETTLTKAYHGMPLAVLLGFGDSSIVNILEKGPILSPKHVCLIGVRSFEQSERALLNRLGVRIYFMNEVKERGFQVVFEEALELVKKGTKGFGLSIDLDAFDPEEVPGVGSPAANGLRAKAVLPALSKVQNDSHFKALEIVEYNPDRDKDNKTLLLMRDLLKVLLAN